ncbi:hypothetical protein MMC14_009833 [Varicellaria rhodocarpa]|nr:hypothetical protein [Varicellaria rhodocarpa]
MVGESLADTTPGYLPRTVEELQEGVSPRELLNRNSINVNSQNSIISNTRPDGAAHDTSEVNSEDRIFDLPTPPAITNTDSASPSFVDTTTPSLLSSSPAAIYILGSQAVSQGRPAEYQTRHITSLRRELQRMRAGIERIISGLQDLGVDPHTPEEATARSSDLNSRLELLEQRLIHLGEEAELSRESLMDWNPPPFMGQAPTEASHTNQNSNFLPQHMPRLRDYEQQRPSRIPSQHHRSHIGVGDPQALSSSQRINQQMNHVPGQSLDAHSANFQAFHNSPDLHIQDLHQQLHILNVRIYQYQQQGVEVQGRMQGNSLALQRALSERDQILRDIDVHGNPVGTMSSAVYGRRLDPGESRHPGGQTQESRAVAARLAHSNSSEAQPGALRNQSYPITHRRENRFLPPELQTSASYSSLDQQNEATGDHNAITNTGARHPMVPSIARLAEYRAHRHQIVTDASRSMGRSGENSIAESSRDIYRLMAMNAGTHTMPGAYYDAHDETEGLGAEAKSLDKDDGRPEPLKDEDMMVKLECKVCFSQLATVAVLPCG